jgi:hypothetical protein
VVLEGPVPVPELLLPAHARSIWSLPFPVGRHGSELSSTVFTGSGRVATTHSSCNSRSSGREDTRTRQSCRTDRQKRPAIGLNIMDWSWHERARHGTFVNGHPPSIFRQHRSGGRMALPQRETFCVRREDRLIHRECSRRRVRLGIRLACLTLVMIRWWPRK